MKPLVSILIPAYNAEPFIADTIKSALAVYSRLQKN
jgi:glycosyltransferase involved in cell wall biosynthesis